MNAETTGSHPIQPIVAGVDDSAHSLAAARWAAEEAVARGLPLQLVHVTPYDHPVNEPGVHTAESILALARTEARRHAEGVCATTRLITGTPGVTLLEASADAALLVLGLTGGGRVDEVLLGSATLAVSGRAECPLVGVRAWPLPSSTRREIVLGVGPDTEANVLETAFEMAERRSSELLVVHCGADGGYENPEAVDAVPQWLEDELADGKRRYPAVKVHCHVSAGLVANTLLRQAARAEALVVGSRNRGRATRILLGSTSRALLRHSQVPVVVVGPNVRHEHPMSLSDGPGQREPRAATPTR
jgi:nucleotide-binding universal stress UspA family protein